MAQVKTCIDCGVSFRRPAKCGTCPCCTHTGAARQAGEILWPACDAWSARCLSCDTLRDALNEIRLSAARSAECNSDDAPGPPDGPARRALTKPETLSAARSADHRSFQNPPRCWSCRAKPAEGWSAYCADCGD